MTFLYFKNNMNLKSYNKVINFNGLLDTIEACLNIECSQIKKTLTLKIKHEKPNINL